MRRGRRIPGEDAPISVAIVDDALSSTGSVRWVNTLARQWALSPDLSVRMFLLMDRRDVPLAAPAAGVPLVFGGRPGARLRTAVPRSLPRLIREIARADMALVISEVGFSLPLCYLACKAIGRPLVVMAQSVVHESVPTWVPRRWRRFWLHCLRHADAVACVSEGSAESVRNLGLPPERVSIVHGGIDADEVIRLARSSPPQVVREDEPVLLSCAELSARKGHDLLLRAFAAVRTRGYRTRLVILGEGPERAPLERLAADLGVANCVDLPGFVTNPYTEMQAAHLFCLASRYEAFGLCLLEAMTLAVPIVATDAEGGGPRTLLDGGRLGALVRPNSVEALAEAIARHLDQPAELRSRAAAGPAHAQQFTGAAAATAYQELFRQVTRRFSTAGATPASDLHSSGR